MSEDWQLKGRASNETEAEAAPTASAEQILRYVRTAEGKNTRIRALEESCKILESERDTFRAEAETLQQQEEAIAKISWVDVGLAWMQANRLDPHMSLEKLHNLSKTIVATLTDTAREATESSPDDPCAPR